MKKTEVVFILDKSGSMSDLKKDAVGGYNELLSKLKGLESELYVTTVLFNNTYEIIENRTKISEVKEMEYEDYLCGGSTALLDTIGFTMERFSEVEDRKVLFYITTDGMENSSQSYTYKMIHKMIKLYEKQGFEFNFLASGIDEKKVGNMMGIRNENIHHVDASSKGQAKMFHKVYRSLEASISKEE